MTQHDSPLVYPLSHSQLSFWFLHQLTMQSGTYNALVASHILTDIDILALQNAFKLLIKRHPILRTTYSTHGNRPVQYIHEHITNFFEQADASTWSDEELNQHLAEAVHRPFDLELGSVLRVHVFTRTNRSHFLLLVIHHIAADLWARVLLIDEFRLLYAAIRQGASTTLPELNLQYTDYINWQTQMLAGSEGERLWAYWKQQLLDDVPLLNLPTDRPRPKVQTYNGAVYPFSLGRKLTQSLRTLAQTENVSLFMVLLAAFQGLLYRYTGQKILTVGSPVPGRRAQTEFQRIIGNFINMLVFRADFNNDISFRSFLDQVQRTVLAARQHQEFPFSLLVERLQPKRDPSYSPLFQVNFSFNKLRHIEELELSAFFISTDTQTQLDWDGLTLESTNITEQEGQFDLSLWMSDVDDVLYAEMKYNSDLFEANTIQRMANNFQVFLQSIISHPDQPIINLSLLSRKERDQLLVQWNNTSVNYPKELHLHELIEAQVERTPNAIALIFEGQALTYRELNSRANQVAHHLKTTGVGPDILVGICMDPSLDMVVALLGILKAGGAYVPLNPEYPWKRLAFMLEDTKVAVLLVEEHRAQGFRNYNSQLICLDISEIISISQDDGNLCVELTPENLAYTIYTSGSTGTPKGVQITHRAVVNFLASMRQQPGLTAADILLSVTTLSFDIFGLELYLPLMVGAQVVLVSRATAMDGVALRHALLATHATLMQATPATWRLLLDTGWQGSPRLTVLCGGEALPRDLANRLVNQCAAIWNLYGPTEATIWSTVYHVTTAGSEPIIPIGRPIANVQIYILDAKLQPMPIGVPGELHIGGLNLARGYLNRPELTAEKFIPNPFSNDPITRLYKTGDLARYLPDGNIEYLGRLDHQVKIRGFRIELGEIETVLEQHPAVREAVVIAQEKGSDPHRLVAYIVALRGQTVTTNHLRQFLQEQLPDYMMPSAFIIMNALPLTSNGKIDRSMLPTPDKIESLHSTTFKLPKTDLQQTIAEIWLSILQLKKIDIHDNFFHTGGHSLLAMELRDRVERELGVTFSIGKFFQNPTIMHLDYLVSEQLISKSLVNSIRTHTSRLITDEEWENFTL